MKSVFLKLHLILFLILFCGLSHAQIQTSVTMSAVPIAGSPFATFESAITAVNGLTITGPVVVDATAGQMETITGKITLTATGTSTNTIIIQKSGIGANPKLIAYTGTVATPSVIADGFFVLAGSDYVTIDGIDLEESGANTTTTTVMEFGYGLFKASATDGCQNNIIRNCSITLNRTQNTSWTAPGHNGSCGIAVLNGLYTATGNVTVTAASGSNSNNQIYSNTIQNCNAGIVFIGFAATIGVGPNPDPGTFFGDLTNDIGGNSAMTGNTVLNFGGGAATNPATGIFANNQWSMNCSYNTINNNNGSGVNHTTTLRGIFLNSSSTSANVDCNYNTITMHGGGTTAQVNAIENGFGGTPAGNTVNINNNQISGDYLTATSGVFYLIYNNNTAPGTLNLNNNSISSISYSNILNSGSGANYMIYSTGSNAATILNASNNNINSYTRTGTSGGTTIGIYISGGTTGMQINVNSNTVSGLSIDGSGTSSIMYGIQTPTGTIVCNNNTVQNLSCIKTTGTGAMYGIYNIASPVNETYNDNIVQNLTHNGTGTLYGIYANTATGTRTCSGNLIHSLTGGGTTIAAMNHAASSPNIFNNKIYNIQSNSATNPTVSGILLTSTSTSGTANIYNNLIGDLKAPSASTATAAAPSIRGINITGTSTTSNFNVSYNTVYLNGSSSGSNFGAACLFATGSATSTSGNLTMINNILVNASTPAGVGLNVAYQRSSTNTANYDNASNNNLFYTGTPSATNLIYYDGTNSDQTLVDFKARVTPRESSSVTENPVFRSTSGPDAVFLHINQFFPTQIESGGIPVAGITTDFDGGARSLTTPDIGADEFVGTPVDLVGPAISYTILGATSCLLNRDLSATITDASGINITAGTKPRLYFKKSTDANTYAGNTNVDNGWKYVEASNAASPFTFTTDYSLLQSAVIVGDIIEYFVVAQDLAMTPNIGINSGIFNTPPTSVALSASAFPLTGTINDYNIIAAGISGTANIGAIETYATLTGTGGLFETINNVGLSGNLTAVIMDATITEDGSVALNEIGYNGCSAGPYTLTIKPNTSSTLTGNVSSGAVIKLNGADNVTIDGSNSGGSDRSLTIENTNTAANSAAIWIASLGTSAGANNDVVKNCNIFTGEVGTTTSLNTFGIYVAGTTISSSGSGADNDNILIQNNSIKRARYGIYARGTSAGINDNLMITSNDIGAVLSSDYVTYRGVDMTYAMSPVISGNTIFNLKQDLSASNAGIEMGAGVSSAQIDGNEITGIYSESTSGYGAYGILFSSTTSVTGNTISNNMISDIRTVNYSSASTTFNAFGIRLAGGTGTSVYNNSINLFGDITLVSGSPTVPASACLLVTTTSVTGLNVQNNIFRNTQTFNSGTPKTYALWMPSVFSGFNTINNNDYYGEDGTMGNPTDYSVGRVGAVEYADLNAWKAFTTQEANSFEVAPTFISNTDLHLNTGLTPTVFESTGALVGVATDIDGQTRPGPAGSVNGGGTAPDLGADEFDGVPALPMTLVSVTATQNNTTNVPTNAINQEVIGVEIVVNGDLNPLSVTSITMNTNGTTNTADIENARVWFTGTSSVFATTTQFGSTVSMPSGSMMFSGSQVLSSPGTYYFWLTYDIPCGVTLGNVIDAECNSVTIGSAQVPSVQAPVGSRTIVSGPLSGLYTVGTGGTYNTLTEAVADINAKGLSGSVQLRILSDLNEPGTVVINQWTECGGSGFTLTIRPQSATTPTITANGSSAVIKLEGADRVTIDGSNSGSDSRDLTIINTNTSASSGGIWISSLGAGAGSTDNIIRNCIIKTGSNTVNTYGVSISGATIASTGAENQNNTIQNNWIQSATYGIYASGVNATGELGNLLITQNKIGGDMSSDYVTGYGIFMTGATGPVVTYNEVYNMIYNGSKYGLWFGTTVHEAVVSYNKVYSFGQTNTTATYYCIGIYFSSTTGNTNNEISNNFITDLHQYGSTSNFYYCGVRIVGGTNYKLYYNTINISGAFGSSTAGVFANCLFVSTASTNMDIRNNIFSNTRTGNAPKAYAINTISSTTYSTIDYNDYYSSGAALGLIGGAEVADFAALQTATGQDVNSVNIQPVYFSDTDVHLFPASNPTLNGLGTPIGGITTDIDGDTRNGTNPDMGGDEWEPSTDQVDWCNLQWPPTGSIYPHNSYNAFGQAYEAGITDGPGQAAGLLAWIGVSNANTNPNTWSNDAWIPATFNTQVGNNDEFIGTIPSNSLTPGTYYYAFRYSLNYGPYTYGGYSVGGGGFWDGTTYVSGVLTVNSCPTITPSATPSTICVGESSTLNVTSSNNDYTYEWNPGMLVGAMQIVNPASTTLYTVTATDNMTGCVVTSDQTVTVVPLPTVGISPAGPINISCGAVQALSGSVAANVKDYLFTPSSGTFTPISGGTDVDVVEDDDTHSGAIPIGFSFTIEGNSYSNLYANSNGWLSFNTNSGTATATQWRTNISTAPASMLPLIAPLWDDNDGFDAPGQAKYVTEGTAPNRVFTFEWLNWEWYFTADAPVLSFQVKLYETTNKIEFIYRQEANAPASPSASVGLMTSSSNYLMLDGTGASPMALSNTFTTNLSTKPATGQIYAFEPPMASNYLWSGPSGTLFTDMAATMPYAGENIGTVYAKPNTSGTNTYMITITDGNGCENTASRDIEVGPCNVSLDLTSYIEGFMDGGSMRPVLLNSGIGGAMASQCDTITVSLHNNTAPYAKAFEYKGVLGVNGTINCSFPSGANGNSYYIVVTHRSALETWSATPQLITGTNTYNFSTGSGQAFGGNMVQVGGIWCFYSGNIDGTPPDDNIDLVDYPIWETDYNNFLSGYFKTDLNGDGVVDLIDYPIWETNANNFISVFRP